MATSAVTLPSAPLPRPSWDAVNLSRAPLVPLALGGTFGIVLDRYLDVPLALTLAVTVLWLLAWGAALVLQRGPGPFYLCAALVGLGAAYHHWHSHALSFDDIAHVVHDEPQLIWLRGVVASVPRILHERADPLSAFPESSTSRFLLQTTQHKSPVGWRDISGLVQVIVEGELAGIDVGNEVEVVGQIATAGAPDNPGAFDYARYLRDRRIRAVLQVRDTTAAITLRHGGQFVFGVEFLAPVKAWAKTILDESLPHRQHAVAGALLLGDDAAMSDADWEKYLHTGVVHVLAISGQHLAVLGGFVWLALRVLGVRRRRGALCVLLFVLGYALLVGGRPPVLRAAGMVAILCGGLLWQRHVLPANSFAFAWLVVAFVNPTDIFNAGCQLSFLAVAVLLWGAAAWNSRDRDALMGIIDESRPPWLQLLLRGLRFLAAAFVMNAAVWFAVMPLIASRHHLVSPIALLIGPPLILLTSIALLAGFMLLLGGHILWPLAVLLSQVMSWSLDLADAVVNWSLGVPFGYFYVPDIPEWLMWVFYVSLFAVLTLTPVRRRWRWWLTAGFLWCALVFVLWISPRQQSFRCGFIAVGHGSCILIETGDKVLLYDAGAISGPEITRRTIAPYLWSRGVYHIDELFLSHADLDHFNGVPALLQRFTVKRVNLTPSFREREAAGVQVVIDGVNARHIPVRILSAGMRLRIGGAVIDVLHPPQFGPKGKENARSMVLLCHAGEYKVLLTGDLEEEGLQQLLGTPPTSVDVLMAPHHGSKAANTPRLAAWARPRVVVSCQGRSWRNQATVEPYSAHGAHYLPTWPHGTVVVETAENQLKVETYRTKRTFAP